MVFGFWFSVFIFWFVGNELNFLNLQFKKMLWDCEGILKADKTSFNLDFRFQLQSYVVASVV